jgi:hypothetical protein
MPKVEKLTTANEIVFKNVRLKVAIYSSLNGVSTKKTKNTTVIEEGLIYIYSNINMLQSIFLKKNRGQYYD